MSSRPTLPPTRISICIAAAALCAPAFGHSDEADAKTRRELGHVLLKTSCSAAAQQTPSSPAASPSWQKGRTPEQSPTRATVRQACSVRLTGL
jgi:hypothetical protein